MQTYYHLAPLALAPGSIIERGNWGRILRDHSPGFDAPTLAALYRELAFEYARKMLAPNAPSRLDCVFLFLSEPDARAFQEAQRNWRGVLHEVEPVDIAGPNHRTSWTLFDSYGAENHASLLALNAKLRSYWTDSPSSETEVLWGGSVRILCTIPHPQSLAYRGIEQAPLPENS